MNEQRIAELKAMLRRNEHELAKAERKLARLARGSKPRDRIARQAGSFRFNVLSLTRELNELTSGSK